MSQATDIRNRLSEKRALDIVELRGEIERLRTKLDEETKIVDRIWELLGNPGYDDLKGRSIYDLIQELIDKGSLPEIAEWERKRRLELGLPS